MKFKSAKREREKYDDFKNTISIDYSYSIDSSLIREKILPQCIYDTKINNKKNPICLLKELFLVFFFVVFYREYIEIDRYSL